VDGGTAPAYDGPLSPALPGLIMPIGEVTVYTDGASRGNPGPAAVAFVLQADGSGPIEYSDRIGKATNNAAEYTAMIRALEFALSLGARRVRLYSDSEL